jgi:hypothetical protein
MLSVPHGSANILKTLMLRRRDFIRSILLGLAVACFAPGAYRLRPPELPVASDEIVILEGWVLVTADLAAVL